MSDRYLIEREIGCGGMATDFLGRDLKSDRMVALKVLHPELAAVLGSSNEANCCGGTVAGIRGSRS